MVLEVMKKLSSDRLTLVLVNIAGIMEKADETLLPNVYTEIGKDLHTDPTGLGSLTLFRSLVQCLCYPLAAYLSAHHNRAHVIALGAFLWSAATFLVAISSTFTQMAISRGLNGIGLAIVTPAIQSLVADSTNESNRGTAFGWLALTSSFGSILGGLLSVLIAETSFMGIPGWRLSFHLVGIVSVVVGFLVRLFANDPRYLGSKADKEKDQLKLKSFQEEVSELLKEAKAVIKVPSFQILIAQGVSGTFPWSALSFATMWLELIGFSHKTTALLWTLFRVADSLGSLFGGFMGDVLSKHLPNSGRIILAQISTGSAIPIAAILLLLLPNDPKTATLHGLVLFIMGSIISWCGSATNNPIFAEIVPERARTSIYALDRSFETIISSFAPLVVGILAQQVFGYKPIPEGSTGSQEIETDRQNAASLAKALYAAIGIPMVICCSIYSFLYFTYPQDRDRVRLQLIEETDNSPSEEQQPLLEKDEHRILSAIS
ncbi:tetracycline resistance protein, class B-like [Solanum tuberosum]|nr:PREDICTED: tetracycline resistance protein, class B-like [Solanum tuberosum]